MQFLTTILDDGRTERKGGGGKKEKGGTKLHPLPLFFLAGNESL